MLSYLFAFLLFVHGLIHCMGFAKAYGYGTITQFTNDISRPQGIAWLFTALLFMAATLLMLLKKESWPYIALVAVVMSQVLIITVWKDAKYGSILNLVILVVAIAWYATDHFERRFAADVNRHLLQTDLAGNVLLTEADMLSLPLPVQQYIRYTGAVNKPKVKNMRVVFAGKMRDRGKDFFTFSAVQYNFFDNPARLFFMKAKMYGITVPGYHCYQQEHATMQVKLFGLLNVVQLTGTEMDKAETVTLFNDMCLMAPAALTDKRIEWTAVDSLSARAIFTNGKNRISATLFFNEQGQLINFISDDRYAIGDMKQYRFSTPVKDYVQTGDRRIWTYGETIWHYPEGEFVYGKFMLKTIKYNLSGIK